MHRLTFATLLLAILAACGDVSGPASVAGTYTLITMDGQSLPYRTWQQWNVDDFVRMDIMAGAMTLDRDGTCNWSFAWRRMEYTAATDERKIDTGTDTMRGTFSVSGSLITFMVDEPGPDSFTRSVSGDTITIDDDGFVMVYEK